MPRLELSIAGLPTTAAVGELLRVQVRHLDVLDTSPAAASLTSVAAPTTCMYMWPVHTGRLQYSL
jgi:hypothetical protein